MNSYNVTKVFKSGFILTFIFLLISSFGKTGLAQITHLEIDSLQQVITKLPEDSAKVNRLLLLSKYFLKLDKHEEASEAVIKAENLSRTIDFTGGVILSLLQHSQIHVEMADYTKALSKANEALEIDKSHSNYSGVAKTLYKIGRIYAKQADYDKAIEIFKQSVENAEKGNNIRAKGDAQIQIAIQYAYKGLSEEIRVFAEQARLSYEQVNYPEGLAYVYNCIGESYRMQSRYTEAIESFYKGLKIAEDNGLTYNRGQFLNNIGIILFQQEKFQQAIDIYLKLIEINEEAKNYPALCSNTTNIGLVYANMGNYQEAITWYNKGLEANEFIDNERLELKLHHNLGEAYMALLNHDQAIHHFKKAYQIAEETSDEQSMTYIQNGLGHVHVFLQNFEQAAGYLQDARITASREGYKEALKDNYQSMVKLDSMQNNYEGAFAWYKKYDMLRDSINDELKSKRITEIQAQYESEKKDKEILQLNQTKELAALHYANERKLFIVVVLFLTLLTVALIYIIFKRREANRLLYSQKQEIEEKNEELSQVNEEINLTLEVVEQQNEMLCDKNNRLEDLHREKDGLIGVVAHDLRSPIAKAQGLAELARNAGPLNEKQEEFISLIRTVCKEGMRLIEDLLMMNMAESSATSANCKPIDLNQFLADLIRNYQNTADKKNINLQYNSNLPQSFQINSDRDYLTRVLDNLMSNAIKFTFPFHAVYLEITQENEQVLIIIRDEGQGMSEEDKTNLFKKFKRLSAKPTGGESSTGLGLSIVKTLVKKLNGNISVESELGKGTTFAISLPVVAE